MSRAILLLKRFHLVLQAELQLLQSHFLDLFVFGEVFLLDERVEALRVLRVFIGQAAEFFVTREKLIANLR
jgi:hypothetical protein